VGRQELIAFGYDPDETTIPPSPEEACSSPVLEHYLNSGGFPLDETTLRDILSVANADLLRAGLASTATRQTVELVINNLRSAGLTE
jgi:hypothetical protein